MLISFVETSGKQLHIPQEIVDLIAESIDDNYKLLEVRHVCRSLANALAHRIVDEWNRQHLYSSQGPSTFEQRNFEICVDDDGVASLEALTHPALANKVRHIVIMDRNLVSYYLEPTRQDVRDRWIKSRATLEAQYTKPMTWKCELNDVCITRDVRAKTLYSLPGLPELLLRDRVSPNRDFTGVEWWYEMLSLRYQDLVPPNDQISATSLSWDYTIRPLRMWVAKTLDLRASSNTTARLHKALSSFKNLQTLRTAPREVMFVDGIAYSAPNTSRSVAPEQPPIISPRTSCLIAPDFRQRYYRRIDQWDHTIVWPACLDLGITTSDHGLNDMLDFTLKELELDIYPIDHCPQALPSAKDANQLGAFISSCSNLTRLCLRAGRDPRHGHADYKVDLEMRQLLKSLAASGGLSRIKDLEISQAAPADANLVQFLRHSSESLESISLVKSIYTKDYATWIGLLTTTTDMPNLRELRIDFNTGRGGWENPSVARLDLFSVLNYWDNLADWKTALSALRHLRGLHAREGDGTNQVPDSASKQDIHDDTCTCSGCTELVEVVRCLNRLLL